MPKLLKNLNLNYYHIINHTSWKSERHTLTTQTVVMMHVYLKKLKHVQIFIILFLRMKLIERKNCTKRSSNFCNIVSIFDSFRECINSEIVIQ